VAVWPSDMVVVSHINKVTLCRAWLVLRCMTIYRYTTLVCNQPLRLTQPPTLIGKGNKYWSRAVEVLCAGKVTVGLALHQLIVTGSVIYPPTG